MAITKPVAMPDGGYPLDQLKPWVEPDQSLPEGVYSLDQLRPWVEPAKSTSGDFSRGFQVSMGQTAPIAKGVVGLVGATAEKSLGVGESVKDWGLHGYEEGMKKLQPLQKDSDNITSAWAKAKQGDIGALIDWAQYGLGYTLGQVAEAGVAAGIGAGVGAAVSGPAAPVGAVGGAIEGVVAKGALKTAAKAMIEKAVAKEALDIAEKQAAKSGVTLAAEDLAAQAATETVRNVAARNVAKSIGSNTALAAYGTGQELGSIYPEAEAQAAKEGRELSGVDLAKVWGTGLAAGGLEAFTDKLGIDLGLGKLKLGGDGRIANATRGLAAGAAVEAGTEGTQTVLERLGAGQDLTSPEAYNDYINSMALGGIGGGAAGALGGAFSGSRKRQEDATQTLDNAQDAGAAIAAANDLAGSVTELTGAVDQYLGVPSPTPKVEAAATVNPTLDEEAPITASPSREPMAVPAAVSEAFNIPAPVLETATPVDETATPESEPIISEAERTVPEAVSQGLKPVDDAKSLTRTLSTEGKIFPGAFGEEAAYNYTTPKGVEVTLKDFDAPNGPGILVDFIGSKTRGQGLASEELDRVIAMADKHDLPLGLNVNSEEAVRGTDDTAGLSDAQLKQWYERKGFIFQRGSSFGYRPAPTEDATKLVENTTTVPAAEIPTVEEQVNTDWNDRTHSDKDSFLNQFDDGNLKEGYHIVPGWDPITDESTHEVYYYDGSNKPSRVENLTENYDYDTGLSKIIESKPAEEAAPVVAGKLDEPSNGNIIVTDADFSQARDYTAGNAFDIKDVDENGEKVPHQVTVVDTKALGNAGLVLEQIGRIFGKKLVVFKSDTLQADGFVRKGDNRNIFINESSGISPLAVFGHELLHILKRDNPIAYKALAAVVAKNVTAQGKSEFKYEYGEGANTEELIADLMGNRFQDPTFWQDVFNEINVFSPDNAKDIITRLTAAITKAVNAFIAVVKQPGFKADKYVKDLEAVKRAALEAVVAYANSQKESAMQYEMGRVKAEKDINLEGPTEEADLSTKRDLSAKSDKELKSILATLSSSDPDLLGIVDAIEQNPNALTSTKLKAKQLRKDAEISASNTKAIRARKDYEARILSTKIDEAIEAYDTLGKNPNTTPEELKAADDVITQLNKDYSKLSFEADLSTKRDYKLDINREEREVGKVGVLTADEQAAVAADGVKYKLSKDQVNTILEQARDTKKRFPQSAGWAPLKLLGIAVDTNKITGKVKIEPKWQALGYGFNVPPGEKRAPAKMDKAWAGKVISSFHDLVKNIYDRAEKGDKNAQTIIAHQTWYRNVAEVLRRDFGAQGDLIADLLGATSPNTPVDTNWKFTVDILKRFVRGDFNADLEKFKEYVDNGGQVSKYPSADKIRQISGKLYGMNSGNAMIAALDLWRVLEPGSAPKARNFALNLIGQSNMATIDVWAARMLRRAANRVKGVDLPRIPPPAEQGVSGVWNADVSGVTGEFGFGAYVMEEVAKRLQDENIDITAPDLQAIAWFAEKELWGEKNWTTVTGEGGSFEENLEAMPMDRYIAGWSIQQGEKVPDPGKASIAQARVMAMLTGDNSVIAARVVPTKGLYGGTVEQSFDTEWTVDKAAHDPSLVMAEIAKLAEENNQYDMFVSRVIAPKEENANARPGVEVYFKTQQDLNKVLPVLEAFTANGQDGFTLAIDPRAKGEDNYIGVRLQYVPEISMRWDEDLRARLQEPGELETELAAKRDALNAITADVSQMEGVAYAKVVDYDTVVVGKENYNEYINRAASGTDRKTGSEPWFGQPVREAVKRAAARYESDRGQDGAGSVSTPSGELPAGEVEASRRRNYAGAPAPQAAWTAPISDARTVLGQDVKLDSIIYSLQDKMIDTKRVVQSIKDAIGQIDERFDAYLKEELFHGRAATQTKKFLSSEIDPLIRDMQSRGVTMDQIEEYLHNKHAVERNEQIATINENLPDQGSGIKTADALAYLAALTPAQKRTYEALATRVQAINRGTQQLLVDSGLEKQSTIDAWNRVYQNYVPLQREDLDFGTSGGTGTGQGFSVKGAAAKRATGSTRQVVDIMANIVMQRERVIVRAEKNRVAQSVYGLAIKAPNDGFWLAVNPAANKSNRKLMAELISMGLTPADANSIMEEPTVKTLDPKTGLVVERINPALRNRDNVLSVRVNGEERYVFFNNNDERSARMVLALKNLDADQLSRLMSVSASITRYFSAVNTQYNPIFGIINMTRDVQGALLNLSTTEIADKKGQVLRDTMSAWRGIYVDLRADRKGAARPQSQWAQLWEEFQAEGGQTGFRDQFLNSQSRADDLQREINKISEGKVKQAGRAIFDWLSDYNETMENAVRLAAYKAALDKGMSKAKAASVAKNLTVNFNRKGQVASQANALYAFFNASVQGSARLIETMKGPAGRKIFIGGLLLGSMQAMLLAAAGFREDEPPYFVRERNIIIPIGGGKYITIPMPLGFHAIPNTGRVMTEWALAGFKDPAKRIGQITGTMMDAFNPVGNAGWSLQTIMPTVLDPAVALVENKDFTGKRIYKEDFNSLNPTPGYTRAKDTATWFGKEMAYAINIITGGNKYRPGMVSPTPDQIDYLVGQVTGGVGRELSKAEQLVTSVVSGEELPTYKVPLVGRFVGDTKQQASQASRFYENVIDINELDNELKGRRKDKEGAAEFYQEHPEARLGKMADHVQQDLSKLRKRKALFIERGAPKESIKMIDLQITRKMELFNTKVDAARDQAEKQE